jgi:hypothetical protein
MHHVLECPEKAFTLEVFITVVGGRYVKFSSQKSITDYKNTFSFRGASPPDPLTRGFAPGPH